MIKLIFCDMDGTLLDDAGQMPPMFDEVVGEILRRGAVFCPASGRQYSALLRQMGRYIDDFIFVAENGTFVARHDREMFSAELDGDEVARVLSAGAMVPEAYPVLCGKRLAYVTPRWMPYMDNMHQYFTQCAVVPDLAPIVKEQEIIKVAFCDAEFGAAEERIYPPLSRLEGPVRVVLSSHYWVDVMRPGVNKGVAVQRLQKLLGVAPEECAAFGDYLNDVEMLEAVGHGFAMANAHPAVKEAAREEAPPNTAYGVMTKLRELLDMGAIGGE